MTLPFAIFDYFSVGFYYLSDVFNFCRACLTRELVIILWVHIANESWQPVSKYLGSYTFRSHRSGIIPPFSNQYNSLSWKGLQCHIILPLELDPTQDKRMWYFPSTYKNGTSTYIIFYPFPQGRYDLRFNSFL